MTGESVVGQGVDASTTVDGRRVFFCLYGPDSGRPVVFHYGTPGTRRLSPQSIAAARRANARLLVIDRPGYGDTDRWADRRIADVVDDVVAVVDTLGWDRFAVWGGSGGAPHALACAAMLPQRVTRCTSVVGPAPFDAPDLDWFADMSAGNVEEFTLAAAGEGSYRPLVQRLADDAVAAVAAGQIQVAGDYDLPDVDVRALQARLDEDGYQDRMRATYTGGVDGWIDDCIAMTRPWGFDLSSIDVPTSIWYGPDDVLSPRGHAEHLIGAVANADRRELLGGHVLADADLDAIYQWLLND